MNIGRAVRQCRAVRGLTQKELASAADLDPSYVSLIESGRRMPSLDVLCRVAQQMEVPVYMLVLLSCEEGDAVLPADRERARRWLQQLTVTTDAAMGTA